MSLNNFSHELTLFQKIKNYDFILLFCILILGITSIFTMYSTDGGEVLFHTKSHFIKFSIFFPMMIILSFINIKYWHAGSYLFYVLILGLLVWVALYGVTKGDILQKGDKILVLEAMKMEHALVAPQDCVVDEVLVRIQDQVEADAHLVRLSPAKGQI